MIDKKDKPKGSEEKQIDSKETAKHDVEIAQSELQDGKIQGKREIDQLAPEERLKELLKRANFPEHEAIDVLREMLNKHELSDTQPLLALAQRMFSVGAENSCLAKDNDLLHVVLAGLIKFAPSNSIATPAADFGMYSNHPHVIALAVILRVKQVSPEEALREVNQALTGCEANAVDSILFALLTSPDEQVKAVGLSALKECQRPEATFARERFLRAA